MTQQHPITPPPELVQQWHDQAKSDPCGSVNWVAVKAAQWGADQELEACVQWMDSHPLPGVSYRADDLRDARRPKPPSLKEESIALIDRIQAAKEAWDISELDTIRRALEALPE